MAEYYLISQLPSLDGISDGTPLPITEERFLELCNRLLSKKTINVINNITLCPLPLCENSGSSLIDDFNESERNLRFALGKVRAEKLGKTFDLGNRILPIEYVKAAASVIEMDNPLEAERFLNRFRLDMLDTLRPTDSFSDDYIYYYGIKLKLLLRIRQFDTEVGEKAYAEIYKSILFGN